MKIPLEWMIWGQPYVRKPSCSCCFDVQTRVIRAAAAEITQVSRSISWDHAIWRVIERLSSSASELGKNSGVEIHLLRHVLFFCVNVDICVLCAYKYVYNIYIYILYILYIYIYCIYIYIYCIHIYLYVYIYMYIRMYIYIICLNVYIYIYVYIFTSIYMYTYIFYTRIYLYIYICIYMYICIFI